MSPPSAGGLTGMADPAAQTVDDYLATLAEPARTEVAEAVRRMRAAAPDAVESVSYGMPTFRLPNGHPIYVAGWKTHLSLHDVPPLPADLEERVGPLRSGKDTVQFPFRQSIPHDLIGEIVSAVAARPVDAR